MTLAGLSPREHAVCTRSWIAGGADVIFHVGAYSLAPARIRHHDDQRTFSRGDIVILPRQH